MFTRQSRVCHASPNFTDFMGNTDQPCAPPSLPFCKVVLTCVRFFLEIIKLLWEFSKHYHISDTWHQTQRHIYTRKKSNIFSPNGRGFSTFFKYFIWLLYRNIHNLSMTGLTPQIMLFISTEFSLRNFNKLIYAKTLSTCDCLLSMKHYTHDWLAAHDWLLNHQK